MQQVKQLLDYMYSNPTTAIQFQPSDMIINVYSGTLYLSVDHKRCRTGGYFFLGRLPRDGKLVKLNRNILIACAILKLGTASTDEVELGALSFNTKEARVIQLILAELGHPQPLLSFVAVLAMGVSVVAILSTIANVSTNSHQLSFIHVAMNVHYTQRTPSFPAWTCATYALLLATEHML